MKHKINLPEEDITIATWRELDLSPSRTFDGLMNDAVNHMNQGMLHVLRAGALFAEAKRVGEAMSLDERTENKSDDFRRASAKIPAKPGPKTNDFWHQSLEKWGISRERADECIRIYSFWSKAPAAKRQALIGAGKSKALLLSALPPEAIEQIPGETWDELTGLPYRVLKAKLRRAEEEKTTLAKQIAAQPKRPLPYTTLSECAHSEKSRRLATLIPEWANGIGSAAEEATRALVGVAENTEREKAAAYLIMALASARKSINEAITQAEEILGRKVTPEDTLGHTIKQLDSLAVDWIGVISDVKSRLDKEDYLNPVKTGRWMMGGKKK